MDNQVVYTKVPQYEHDVKIKGQEPPPYVTGDEEALVAEQRGEEKYASCVCVWARIVGTSPMMVRGKSVA